MAEDIGGIWRTIGGRRVFIKDGDDLQTAMRKSGKFNFGSNVQEDKLERISGQFYTTLEDLQNDVEEQGADVLELNEEMLVIGYEEDGDDVEAGYDVNAVYVNEKLSTITIGKRKYKKIV